MKDKILKLRSEGKSYKQIKKILGCAISTISYHCGEGQKEKSNDRRKKRRQDLVIENRVRRFKDSCNVNKIKMKDKIQTFQKRSKKEENNLKKNFKWQDVIEKFGWETTCYLTGEVINLKDPNTYHFDHVIPCSRGGTSDLSNLGIAAKKANQAKYDMTVEEFLNLCQKVLEHNGYEVKKK